MSRIHYARQAIGIRDIGSLLNYLPFLLLTTMVRPLLYNHPSIEAAINMLRIQFGAPNGTCLRSQHIFRGSAECSPGLTDRSRFSYRPDRMSTKRSEALLGKQRKRLKITPEPGKIFKHLSSKKKACEPSLSLFGKE